MMVIRFYLIEGKAGGGGEREARSCLVQVQTILAITIILSHGGQIVISKP